MLIPPPLSKLTRLRNWAIKTKFCLSERFSNECRSTKTKVITPANHNKHKLERFSVESRK